MINGGGAVSDSRGGYLLVHGNEHSSNPGIARLHAGNVGTAYVAFNTGGNERLRILSDGKVGINTSTPSQQFTSYAAAGYPILANGPSNAIGLGGNGAIVFGTKDIGSYAPGIIDASTLEFKISGSPKFNINSSGNLGLGESSSIDARLHVNSGTDNATLFLESTDGDVNLCMADNAGSCRLLQAGGNLRFRTGGNANAFGTGDSEKMVLDGNGRLLLGGGSSPSQVGDGRLIVYADTRLHPAIKADCIDGGINRANGFTLLADNYGADESQVTLGVSYSSSALVLSRGVKVSNAADDTYLSSQDSYAMKPSVFKLDDDGSFRFLNTNTSATTTTDSAVTLTEKLRITSDGGTVISKGGTMNTASGWAGLEIKSASNTHQLVLSSTGTASNSNYARLGFKLHPSNDNERVKAAIVCQGSGGGYGEVSRMMFCLDGTADNGSADGNGADERLRITKEGSVFTSENGTAKSYPIIMGTDTQHDNHEGQFNYNDVRSPSGGIGGWVFLGYDYGSNPYPVRRFKIAAPENAQGTRVYQVWHDGDANYDYGGLYEIRINQWANSSRFESVSIRCINGNRTDLRVVAYNDSKGIMIQTSTIWGAVYIRKAGWDDNQRRRGSSYCAVENNGALAIYNSQGTDDGTMPSGGTDVYCFDGAGGSHTGGRDIENSNNFNG